MQNFAFQGAIKNHCKINYLNIKNQRKLLIYSHYKKTDKLGQSINLSFIFID